VRVERRETQYAVLVWPQENDIDASAGFEQGMCKIRSCLQQYCGVPRLFFFPFNLTEEFGYRTFGSKWPDGPLGIGRAAYMEWSFQCEHGCAFHVGNHHHKILSTERRKAAFLA
jgi:hypothetical protein